MAFIKRDADGNIDSVYEVAQADATEYLAIDSPELTQYLVNMASDKDLETALSDSDRQLVRVLEDLIDTLVDKNIIMYTDLPLAAREKLANRNKLRARLNNLTNLMSDDEEKLF